MKHTNAEAAPETDKTFLDVVTAHQSGDCISDLSAAIKQVTAAVQLTGRAGKVTLEMLLRPASGGSRATIIFETDIKTKIPKAEAQGSIFFADDDYNLVRDDPNQKKLDLRIAAEKDEELRKATP